MKRLLSSLLRVSKISKDQLDLLFWRIIIGTYAPENNAEADKVEKSIEERPLLADSKDGKCESVDKPFSPVKLGQKKDESKCKPIQPENYKFLENLVNYITKGNK